MGMYYVTKFLVVVEKTFELASPCSVFESDVACFASPRPPPSNDEPTLFPGAARSQSPQADSPLSYPGYCFWVPE